MNCLLAVGKRLVSFLHAKKLSVVSVAYPTEKRYFCGMKPTSDSPLHPLDNASERPAQLNNPFSYEPHPLCLVAADEVKAYVEAHATLLEDARKGKMLGVLVVEKDGALGFLAAYSGLLAGRNDWAWFVPPVFDAQQPDGHYKVTERQISALNEEVRQLQASGSLPESDEEHLQALKQQRRQMSEALQLWLFRNYRVLNAQGDVKDLVEIWRDYHTAPRLRQRFPLPPGGTGDCCAPKLLQYAFANGLKPLAIAEFWYGASPKAEVRHHGQFYPACRGKCLPILTWMLSSHFSHTPQFSTLKSQLSTLYADDSIVVVNKPAGMLSVPGKSTSDSVWSAMRQRFPHAEGPLIVHRLDMATSGLLVIALTNQAYHSLQEQFAQHEVKKRYVAILEGRVEGKGTICLPLRPDPLDRPRQVVDHEHGKEAITDYEVIRHDGHSTRIALYPRTGRTHQLRMHCAHADGLASPIRGDELYGHKAEWLYLHAEEISFTHPTTGRTMTFRAEPEF